MKSQQWNRFVLTLVTVVIVVGGIAALAIFLVSQSAAGNPKTQNPPVALSTPGSDATSQAAQVGTATAVAPSTPPQVSPAIPPPINSSATAPAGNISPSGPVVTSTSTPNPNRLITVISVGAVRAVPDIAYLNIGSQVQGVTASEAMGQASASSDAIYKALLDQGVVERDIQTSGINIYPIMSPSPSKTTPSSPSGYQASFNLSVTVTDLSKVGPILDSVTKAGANQISGISYGLKDSTQVKAQALDQALKAAGPKAEAIASSLGIKVGPVMAVSEDTTGYYDKAAYGMGGQSAAAPVIAPGELTVSVQVIVSYSIQ